MKNITCADGSVCSVSDHVYGYEGIQYEKKTTEIVDYVVNKVIQMSYSPEIGFNDIESKFGKDLTDKDINYILHCIQKRVNVEYAELTEYGIYIYIFERITKIGGK